MKENDRTKTINGIQIYNLLNIIDYRAFIGFCRILFDMHGYTQW